MKTVVYARALIVRNGEMLVNETTKGRRFFGGKVKPTETSSEALAREIAEELGVTATIVSLAFVTEQVKKSKKGKPQRRVIEMVYQTALDADIGAQAAVRGFWPRWVLMPNDVVMAVGSMGPSN